MNPKLVPQIHAPAKELISVDANSYRDLYLAYLKTVEKVFTSPQKSSKAEVPEVVVNKRRNRAKNFQRRSNSVETGSNRIQKNLSQDKEVERPEVIDLKVQSESNTSIIPSIRDLLVSPIFEEEATQQPEPDNSQEFIYTGKDAKVGELLECDTVNKLIIHSRPNQFYSNKTYGHIGKNKDLSNLINMQKENYYDGKVSSAYVYYGKIRERFLSNYAKVQNYDCRGDNVIFDKCEFSRLQHFSDEINLHRSLLLKPADEVLDRIEVLTVSRKDEGVKDQDFTTEDFDELLKLQYETNEQIDPILQDYIDVMGIDVDNFSLTYSCHEEEEDDELYC